MEKLEEFIRNNKKIFILDTNVLLYSSSALNAFEDNIVIIPDVVLDELDKHKRDSGENGYNAREVSRLLDLYRNDPDNGDLINGYLLPSGGLLKIELNHLNTEVPVSWKNTPDTRILRVAKGIKEELNSKKTLIFKGADIDNPVILVSNDLFVRVKASVIGIEAEEFSNLQAPSAEEEYKGRRTVYVSDDFMAELYSTHKVKDVIDKYFIFNETQINISKELINNEYLIIKSFESNSSAIGIYKNGYVKLISKERIYGVEPITAGQTMAMDAIISKVNETPLSIIKGPAGTGKTLLAIAAGLEAVDNDEFKRVLYLRSNTMLDEEIGFLPGTEEEKLEWVLRPVKDNLEFLISAKNNRKNKKSNYTFIQEEVNKIFSEGKIKVESVGFMRGRSLANMFVIIDEAQNLTPQQVKTLLSRAGKNTKIILIGDPEQIDRPFLDYRNNGLTYACDRLKGLKIVKQVTMLTNESERSPLSMEIIKNMK